MNEENPRPPDPGAVLYVDMLGIRDAWRRGGRPAAEAAFKRLREVVEAELSDNPVDVAQGGIETDAAAIMFRSTAGAVIAGVSIFLRAFEHEPRTDRLWLRGVIGPPPTGGLRLEQRMPAPLVQVAVYEYAGELLDAIAAEKAGCQGMRLLIENSLVSDALRNDLKLHISGASLIPFRHLDHCPYPERVNEEYQDVLWMAAADTRTWQQRQQLMEIRLRYSAAHSDELRHAAATQVVFNECAAIISSLRRSKPAAAIKRVATKARRSGRPTRGNK